MLKHTCAATFLCLTVVTVRPGAQAPAAPSIPLAPAGDVVGAGNFIHVVADVDKSQAFYMNIVGLEAQGGRGGAPPAPQPAQRAWITNRPDILRLYNGVGAQYRNGGAGVPESVMRVETMEFKDVERTPVHPRIQDPGAAMILLTVRDLDAVMARVKQNNVPIATAGGAPVTLASAGASMRAVVIKDPDGFFVEVVQQTPQPPTAVPPERNVIRVGFAFTVSDTDRMMRVFKDALGFRPVSGTFASDKTWLDLVGAPGAQVRTTTAIVPGSSIELQFLEFKGIGRKPVAQSTTRDPGTPVLRLRVKDTNATIKKLADVGVKVTSAGGEPVDVAGGANSQRFAITSAPDNLFIQVVQTLPPPASTP